MPDEIQPPSKPKRARKPSVPATLRTRKPIDPRKAAALAEYRAKVAAIGSEDASARMLRVILDKRLGKMTKEDQEKLFDHLAKIFTPILPGIEPQSPAGPPHGQQITGSTGE